MMACEGREKGRPARAGRAQPAGGRLLPSLLLLVGLASALGACAASVTSYQHPGVDLSHVRRVAVLPFANLSGDEFADERIASLFLTRLLRAQVVEVVEAGAVREALIAQRLSAGAIATPEQLVALGAALGVDGLFGGTVEECGLLRSNRESLSQVTLSFTLTETQHGVLVWRAQTHASSASFWRRLFGTEARSLHAVSAEAVDRALGTLF